MLHKGLKIKNLILIIPFILSACHGSKNDFSIKYKFTSMLVENAQNLGKLPEPTSQDSIPASAYVIRVNLQSEILAKGSAAVDYDHPLENTNKIESISVISNADFGSSFLAGSPLLEKFRFFNGSYFSSSSLNALELHSNKNADYLENSVPNKFDLLLISPPTVPSSHKFTVKLTLADGTIFIDSTAQIKLY